MRRFAASFCLVATVLSVLLAPGSTRAQKPTSFVKGIPYQQHVVVGSGDERCSAFGCDVSVPAVPAGKRLVVQHVSLTQIVQSGFTSTARLRTDSFAESDVRIDLVPHEQTLGGGSILVTYSQPVFGFVDAGAAPVIQTGASGAGLVTDFSTSSYISGFLVPLK